MAILRRGTSYTRAFKMILSSDHVSLAGSRSPSIRISKAGTSFALITGSKKEIGSGWYVALLGGTDTNALGDLSFYITASGADDTDFVDQVVTRVTDDLCFPTNRNQSLDVSSGGEAGIDWANIGSHTTAQNLSSTNIDTDQVVASVSGSVGSVTGAVGSVTGAVGSVAGNVDGSVSSVINSVISGTSVKVINSVITGTNVDKAGYSLINPQTFDLTGDITGNLSGSVGSVTGSVGSMTGNVSGSVNSVVNSVITGTNRDKTGYSLSAGQLFVKKNTALANFMFPMIDSSDHVTLKTGLTVTGEVSIDGAAFAGLTNSVSELASGVYQVNLAAIDLNGTNIMLKFTATGGDTRLIELITQT